MSKKLKVAIAHDYLTQRGGAEKVVLAMARAFPDAPIYTTLYDPDGTYPEFRDFDIRTSPINRISLLRKNHRFALPVLPFAASALKIDADVVLASSSGWSHGFRTTGEKIVYCYSPARWLYQRETYLGEAPSRALRALLWMYSPLLKAWDRRAAASASRYFAISSVVKSRIQDAYGLPSTVLPAPQSLDASRPTEVVEAVGNLGWDDAGYYLCISRLLPYKNVDKVIDAFNGGARRLVVVGSGPQESELARLAGSNIVMVKDLSDAQIRWLYSHCSGLVAASYEDFGLTPLEAAAYGKPSAVLRWGGFLDTIDEGVTGVYFDQPDPELIEAAVDDLEAGEWASSKLVDHLDTFSEKRFFDALAASMASTDNHHSDGAKVFR
ncbi:glycosyltransferase [Rhodococcoides fascians]|uniref:glycosyltransferase n=2 Tax=Nocardiaceae TaxID=85025 RepID=UPI000523050C|nr:glycosyltransferase [Rhodococcus fascians]